MRKKPSVSNLTPSALTVDFLSAAMNYRRKNTQGGKELIAKAVGIKGDYKPTVIDATAGLGRDAFILASLGCQVIMIERSPAIAALLQDALVRLQQNPEIAGTLKLSLIHADALYYLAELRNDQQPDVIYLDPMHPLRTKSALVKKEMRLIRDLVGDDVDANTLFTVALQHARKRVVVKRPRLAEPLNNLKPNFAIIGKQQRFDVYQI